jgi:tripartite-type tricarboxylate transporter receptor subunit TctC
VGIQGFDYEPWHGVFAPAGIPPAVIQKLRAAINAVLADPELHNKLAKQGLEVQLLTRDQFVAIVRSDVTKWVG